ncbi:hypothetical protein GCM10010124_36270 [Pilimelia terevasa]|uniref:Methylamine utilisation protein MauE domain-containing protein n=1 Tax=Pilimelia terevasa TaxID=53372 RepID=A0A8J3FKH4_9ACTN|nr:MauE/DoxX family redox-associated membrane protein [Pilimelia terevasa]GGK40286.1 hypothetical protein GCM10010124_36270 [Pilimelia terevasa]
MITWGHAVAAVALSGALLLVAAGIGHLRHPRVFRAGLDVQALLPRRLRGPVAALVGPAEVAVGAAALLAWGAAPGLLGWPLAALALCYTAYTGYTWALLRWRPAAPCGCFGGGAPVTGFVVGRAGVLAAAAWVAAGGAAVLPSAAAGPAAVRALAMAAAAVLAAAVWLVPLLTGAPPPADRAGRPAGRPGS